MKSLKNMRFKYSAHFFTLQIEK